MTKEKTYSASYNWGEVTKYTPDLRSHELVIRMKWFVLMRWIAIGLCATATAGAFMNLMPARLNPVYFAAVAAFLTTANLVYTLMGRNLFDREHRRGELRMLLILQMLIDFLALSVLTYACGSVESPIMTVFMAHIILATLFFDHRMAGVIAASAWGFASLPLILEWAGVIPVLSIFDGSFKETVASSTSITGGFVIGIGSTFFVCWYLMNEISRSLKLKELQLEKAVEMMVRMDKEKTQATLRATHELKAPFAAIKSYVYTLKDGYCGELPPKATQVVTRIGDRCDQLTRKITDIIHLSNLQTLVVTDMNLQPVDLVSLVAEEAAEGGLAGEPRGIRVVFQGDQGLPMYVMGSPAHLRTLFSNLIQNAVQYSRDGQEVEISIQAYGKKASVCVRDNGIGIPKKNLEKIFDEHFRSKNAVEHHANGTGLGLSMVKEIVRLHGAEIRVESTLGQETRFTVHFDVVDVKQDRGDNG